MSRQGMKVYYSDGTIRYGMFNGTVAQAWCRLFATQSEAWEGWERYYREGTDASGGWDEFERGSGEPVVVEVDDCFHWHATATRTHLTSRFQDNGWVYEPYDPPYETENNR